jgi:hypothetical protein
MASIHGEREATSRSLHHQAANTNDPARIKSDMAAWRSRNEGRDFGREM